MHGHVSTNLPNGGGNYPKTAPVWAHSAHVHCLGYLWQQPMSSQPSSKLKASDSEDTRAGHPIACTAALVKRSSWLVFSFDTDARCTLQAKPCATRRHMAWLHAPPSSNLTFQNTCSNLAFSHWRQPTNAEKHSTPPRNHRCNPRCYQTGRQATTGKYSYTH